MAAPPARRGCHVALSQPSDRRLLGPPGAVQPVALECHLPSPGVYFPFGADPRRRITAGLSETVISDFLPAVDRGTYSVSLSSPHVALATETTLFPIGLSLKITKGRNAQYVRRD